MVLGPRVGSAYGKTQHEPSTLSVLNSSDSPSYFQSGKEGYVLKIFRSIISHPMQTQFLILWVVMSSKGYHDIE